MIYLDHNATTPLLDEAKAAMVAALEGAWGNPSSAHKAGRQARAVLDEARRTLAELAGARPEQVVFTSGATEALNQAIHSAGPGRVLVSAVEHPAVWAALEARPDRRVEVLPVGADGAVDVAHVVAEVERGEAPALVIVMAANNETGLLQPVAELTRAMREREVPLLVDAVQWAGRLPIDFAPDYLVVTAHKLGGPKGVGALVTPTDAPVLPLIFGGGQERGLRGGTEPLPAIAGFGAAVAQVRVDRAHEAHRVQALRDRLEETLLAELPGARVIGRGAPRLPNTISLLLPEGVEAEAVVGRLDRAGIAVSTGSACHSGTLKPSRVLTAMGLGPDECFRVVRVSLGHTTDVVEIDRLAAVLPDAIARAR